MKNFNARSFAGYLLVIVVFCFESVVAVAADDYQKTKLNQEESAFLNCSLKCGANVEEGSIFSCLKECQDVSKIPPENVSKVLSIRVGLGVTEEECKDELGKDERGNFVCPLFSNGCCCEGFQDCKKMEQLVKGCNVTVCSTKKGREICSCFLK